MSTKRCKDGVVNGSDNYLRQDYDERAGSDLEVNSPIPQASDKKDDPFGDETNSEVKYRTMAWWLVVSPKLPSNDSANNMLTGKLG